MGGPAATDDLVAGHVTQVRLATVDAQTVALTDALGVDPAQFQVLPLG